MINAHHDLWQFEASIRMIKSDLIARPVFHRERDAIEFHLIIVFAALAISRHLQDVTGMSIKRSFGRCGPLNQQLSKLTATG